MNLLKLKFYFKMGFWEFKKYKALNSLAIFSLTWCFFVFFVSLMLYKITPLLVFFLSQWREGPYDLLIRPNYSYDLKTINYEKLKQQNFENLEFIGRHYSENFFVKKEKCFSKKIISFANLKSCLYFQEFTLFKINLKEEKKFGLLREYDDNFWKGNGALINKSVTNFSDVKIGDKIIILFEFKYREMNLFYEYFKQNNIKFKIEERLDNIKCTAEYEIKGVFDDEKTFGSFRKGQLKMFISDELLNGRLSESIKTLYKENKYTEFSENYKKINYNYLINIIYVNFKNRIDVYQESNYSELRNKIFTIVEPINKYFGNIHFNFELTILRELYHTQQPGAIIKMISNILITLLTCGSVYLLYNIFILTSSFRIYDTGLFRTFGINKMDIFMIFGVQGFIVYLFCLIPSLLLIIGATIYLNSYFSTLIYLEQTILPNFWYLFIANFFIFLLPIISLMIPYRKLINKSLIESLEKNRSKTESLKIEIIDKKRSDFIQYFSFASFSIIVGTFLYYIFPVSIINLDFELMFMIIFLIILLILIGFGLFSVNLQGVLEKVICFIFLIFDRIYIKNLVKMNLTAHKLKNKKTSLIFAVSLTFIQFAYISFISLSTINKNFRFERIGSKFYMSNENSNTLNKVISKFGNSAEFAWVTKSLNSMVNYNLKVKNWGKIVEYNNNVVAISPNYFNFINNYDLISIENSKYNTKKLSPSEFLYTKEGHNTSLLSYKTYELFGLKGNDKYLVSINDNNRHLEVSNVFYTINKTKFYTRTSMISLAKFMEISQTYNENDVIFDLIIIKPKNNLSEDAFLKLVKSSNFNIYFRYGEKEFDKFIDTFKLILIGGSILILLISYISLNIAMIANIDNEKKDIAILRNLGVSKFEIIRVFFYEAFILLIISSFSGIIMGSLLGLLLLLNLSLISPINLTFIFFWELILLIIGFGFGSSFFSTFFPLVKILRKKTVTIMNEIN